MQGIVQKKVLVTFFVVFAVAASPHAAQAKGGGDQNQIILLNDSAAALEDSDPDLSSKLAQFAVTKEKEWQASNADKNVLALPVAIKDIPRLREEIKVLKSASLAIAPTYPLIAKSLNQMAAGINQSIEVKK